jgi:retron-type reverse transcriptase
MENGYTWSVELGIHSYFDNINQDFLINKIQNHISDDKTPNLIITYLKWTVIDVHITYDVNAKESIK